MRDKDGDEDSDTFTIEVTNATPTLSDVAAQSWVKGIAKTVTLPEASGGDSPLTYSVVGSLPSGPELQCLDAGAVGDGERGGERDYLHLQGARRQRRRGH